MNRKLIFTTGFIVLSVLALLLLNKAALILSFVLAAIAFVKHAVIPIKRELAWFVLVSVGGAVVEIVLVNIGSAWTYRDPQFMGIPLYMPIFWGLMGTVVVSLYQWLTEKK